jgi:uncharacterized protein (UPF0276 family)
VARVRRTGPGVGVLFNPALTEFVRTHPQELDYLALIPDRTWVDHGQGCEARFEELPEVYRILREASRSLPIVMHCIGLSICSADVFDEEYLSHLSFWRARHDCVWTSEHLSFSRNGSGHESNAAMALPVPYDREMLDLVVPRVRAAQTRLGCPFLLENNVNYFTFAQQEMTEAQFLNQLTLETGCYLLLDLHNVYTNSINHRFDAESFLGALDLSRVLEIHIAGGSSLQGFHIDSHSGPAEDGVWQLLEFVAPRAPALQGVTFEFHESAWPLLRDDGVLAHLERARGILANAQATELCH